MSATCAPFRVLVVEDFEDFAAPLQTYLLAKGCTTDIAVNGEEALAAIPAFAPDIILLDIGLPGMDGIQVCRAIRRKAEYDYVLIIACTSRNSHETKLVAIEAGFDLFLSKPLWLDALTDILEKHSRGTYGDRRLHD